MRRTSRWAMATLVAAGTLTLTSVVSTPVEAVPARDSPSAEQAVRQLMAPWCGDVAVSVRLGSGGRAGYTQDAHPIFGRQAPTEFITVGLQWPVGHPATRAVALHECAHILQYRSYDHDATALHADMDRVYPNDGTQVPRSGYAGGVEHMADCLSDLLGATRHGTADGRAYTVGYGGTCTAAQVEAALGILEAQTTPALD